MLIPVSEQTTKRLYVKRCAQQNIFNMAYFQTCFDTKKILPVIETWTIYGLDITLATPRKDSFDSLDERRNRLRNDNLLRTRKEQIRPPLLKCRDVHCPTLHIRKYILIGSLKTTALVQSYTLLGDMLLVLLI